MKPDLYKSMSKEKGKLYLDGERMILTSTNVFGTLRKDLIDNIGKDRTKGFLIRYGWNLGNNDAKKALANQYRSVEEILRQGPVLHMLKGYTDVKTTSLKIDHSGAVHVEGMWFSSYEAEEHIRQFGLSEVPVCHTLTGFASGYYSEVCGHQVIFKEVSCKARGDKECNYVGKSLSAWTDEIADEVLYYEPSPIKNELQSTYEQLLQERNNLSKAFLIHQRLTEALMSGSDLQAISDIVYRENGTAIVIEDIQLQPIAFAGVDVLSLDEIRHDIEKTIENQRLVNFQAMNQTSVIVGQSYHRLTSPIFLEKQQLGYCSLLYTNGTYSSEADQMILERVATVCSLYLMNEKSAFEAAERMKGHFLDQILNKELSSAKEIVKRGQFVEMNLDQPYYMVVLKYRVEQLEMKSDLYFHEQLMERVVDFFKRSSDKLIGQRNGNLVFLMQDSTANGETVRKQCTSLLSNLTKEFKGYSFKMGVSTRSELILEAPERYEESVTAVQMTTLANQLTYFDDLGMTALLIRSNDKNMIEQKARQLLGELYDQRFENHDFLKTLYVFLINGGNLEKSMTQLALSKSGLRYRISKLESLLGTSLRDPMHSHQILVTLQVLIAEGELHVD
ncbi:XylR N-terminal domain-containing protein [Geomicrobium sp. JCM 19038]|uniref:XylR N-terminal domain-containing protein n=1 Tax=Geomicrobium sp. JCM 19038 TaxID=1460635 RepID=UPI00045F1F88|nr:XylR N-terminal domain-containing protein [Geomicrobium sp. JCM 19038]GAK09036.1 positive regulator of phenol hydroxylase, DmpR [Geomicrobium sp. JCM 19038]